ncbi:hypothetical protein ACFWCA_41995 [Streptomyces phaeochromogenes]|uniref:hypothetical protein n=1 Tax=Streptomyces phaeochromogenes TaxID=1923 RepID=UPI0036AA192E
MPDGGRRTRQWSQLEGATEQDNEVAALLRSWMDGAQLTLNDLESRLTPEHFSNGHIPSRSTISVRLKGKGLDGDFIQAVADACSKDAADRQRLLQQVATLTSRRARLSPPQGAARVPDPAALANELIAVQRQSLTLQDKLGRALDRAAELERECSTSNRMVMVLLTMVDKLQYRITTLTAKRDKLRDHAPQPQRLDTVHEQLARSEEQRQDAEAALKRAQDERGKAERLAEEAAEQVRCLTEELDRLRGRAGQPDNPQPLIADDPALSEADDIDAAADDIDDALAKASRHLDDGAQRLDRLAHELHQDEALDNSVAATTGSHERAEQSGAKDPDHLLQEVLQLFREISKRSTFAEFVLEQSAEDTVEMLNLLLHSDEDFELAFDMLDIVATKGAPTHICAFLVELRARGNGDSYAYYLLNVIGKERNFPQITDILSALRESQQAADAYQMLTAVGREHPYWFLPSILSNLSRADGMWVIEAVAAERNPADINIIRTTMRGHGHEHYAELLSAPLSHKQTSLAATDPAWTELGPAHDTLGQQLTV